MSQVIVESVPVDELPAALRTFGYAADEAVDLVECGIVHWFRFRVSIGAEPPSARLFAAFRAAGIHVYAGRSQDGAYLLGGHRAAYRSLLQGCPDAPADQAVGAALAAHLQLPLELRPPTRIGGRTWLWGERTYLMGVLNVTPDSFSDGGRYSDVDRALQQAERMIEEGVDLLDIGGESTRPGADPVDADEELRRILPVIRRIKRHYDVAISVDTYKARVAEAAVESGADLVNDVSGLRADPAMAATVAQLGVPVVLMHMIGTPKTMQQNPQYTSVVPEVRATLQQAIDAAREAGVRPENIILDPGIGVGSFGKELEHNLALLRRLRDLKRLGYPVLTGTSRKSLIGKILQLPVDQRLEGTAATVALAVAGLSDIVRVHDVEAMRRVVRVADAVVRGDPA